MTQMFRLRSRREATIGNDVRYSIDLGTWRRAVICDDGAHNDQEHHPLDARRADFRDHTSQRFRCHLSDQRTPRGNAANAPRKPPFVSTEMVSDYVADRLDVESAELVEIAARNDPELALAIASARSIRNRVKERLSGNRD